ncbi:alpha/beta fold hydrolase [Frigidibacter sp. MR17.24]|uniref:alpha/beta fold hydrolase n=1 Tax=Frigidibacter sp. MR17.24 TaxID=3127345 RepID=UPI003FA56B0B
MDADTSVLWVSDFPRDEHDLRSVGGHDQHDTYCDGFVYSWGVAGYLIDEVVGRPPLRRRGRSLVPVETGVRSLHASRPLPSCLSAGWVGGTGRLSARFSVDYQQEVPPVGSCYNGINVSDSGGSGRVVVLLHGWPSSIESWDEQVSALVANGNRVVCIDRRGFGGSDRPIACLSFESLADDIETVFQALDLTDVTLVGFCMGGGEVARYISRHSMFRLRAAVFASSSTPFVTKDTRSFSTVPVFVSSLFTEDATLRSAFLKDYINIAHSRKSSPGTAGTNLWKALALAERCDAVSLIQCLSLIHSEDFSDDLKKANLPCLVLHGDQDAVYPINKTATLTHALLPRSDIEILSGAPNACQITHSNAFNVALISFLSRT